MTVPASGQIHQVAATSHWRIPQTHTPTHTHADKQTTTQIHQTAAPSHWCIPHTHTHTQTQTQTQTHTHIFRHTQTTQTDRHTHTQTDRQHRLIYIQTRAPIITAPASRQIHQAAAPSLWCAPQTHTHADRQTTQTDRYTDTRTNNVSTSLKMDTPGGSNIPGMHVPFITPLKPPSLTKKTIYIYIYSYTMCV